MKRALITALLGLLFAAPAQAIWTTGRCYTSLWDTDPPVSATINTPPTANNSSGTCPDRFTPPQDTFGYDRLYLPGQTLYIPIQTNVAPNNNQQWALEAPFAMVRFDSDITSSNDSGMSISVRLSNVWGTTDILLGVLDHSNPILWLPYPGYVTFTMVNDSAGSEPGELEVWVPEPGQVRYTIPAP